jgi:hypothetical protein
VTKHQEREEMEELRRLTRQRCLEAVRDGIPRASFLAQIIRFLSETRALEEQPETPDEAIAKVKDHLPFPPWQHEASASQATPEPPERPEGATEGDALPRLQTQHRRPLGDTYDF